VTDLPANVSCLVAVSLEEVCPESQRFFNIERDATGQRVAFGSGYGLGRLQVGQRVTQIVALDASAGTDAQGNPLVVRKGDAAPDFTMGFSNDVDWRGVRLSFLVDWQRGGDLVNITQNVYDGGGNAPDQPDGGADRAHKNDAEGISQYVYDASFVKLREIAVSYQLPEGLTSQLFGGRASNVRLELAGRNLKTWTDYPGVDPEVSNFGSQSISRFIDLAPFPPTRSFFFTIGVGY
jgi:TonB-dependent starch-binding outer membrane protein SusC